MGEVSVPGAVLCNTNTGATGHGYAHLTLNHTGRISRTLQPRVAAAQAGRQRQPTYWCHKQKEPPRLPLTVDRNSISLNLQSEKLPVRVETLNSLNDSNDSLRDFSRQVQQWAGLSDKIQFQQQQRN